MCSLITTTRLILALSLAALPFAYNFGILTVFLLVFCFLLPQYVWRLNLRNFFESCVLVGKHEPKESPEYSSVQHEVEAIKTKVKQHYVSSWSSILCLPEKTEKSLFAAVDNAIDRLLLLTSHYQIDICHIIRDVIDSVHLHLQKYQEVRSELANEDSSYVFQKFIDAADQEWKDVHHEHHSDYIKYVTELMICSLLPEEQTAVALEPLSSILAENVVAPLLDYLSEQSNLLKIIILVLADDPESLLVSAESKPDASVAPSAAEVSESTQSSSVDVATDDGQEQSVIFDLNEKKHDDASDGDQIFEDVDGSDSPEDTNTNEYVSDELSKIFRVAPSKVTVDAVKDSSYIALYSERNVPMMAMSSVARVGASSEPERVSVGTDSTSDSQSVDSGLYDDTHSKAGSMSTPQLSPPSTHGSTATEFDNKFLSISIPTTELRTETRNGSKYTLYVVNYKTRHHDPNSPDSESCQDRRVYRRYREFVNLLARLEKSPFSKSLKVVNGPKRWHQIPLRTLKSHEVEKRRKHLELFLQQLISNPILSSSKDLEEFLAYNGGGEIEFVQEKVELIPSAVRLDKMVIRKVSDMMGMVSGKLSSQNLSTSAERKSAPSYDQRRPQQDTDALLNVIFSVDRTPSELLDSVAGESGDPEADARWLAGRSVPTQPSDTERLESLANSICSLILYLIQMNNRTFRRVNLVATFQPVLLSLLKHWLRNKMDFYTLPEQLARLLALFQSTIWPTDPQPPPEYDIKLLTKLAVDCIIHEFPKPVYYALGQNIDCIIDYILEASTHSQINRQLGLCILNKATQSSLRCLTVKCH